MNCSFNIRYKPRTTRAFTKNDLTVYDSAGNTALNALTVYGKSEVVDGTIKSAGEGGSIEVQSYTGTNQFGGLDYAQKLHNASLSSVIDTTNKTVTFNHYISSPTVIYDNFKPNTQYTLILRYINENLNNSLLIKYTDNTQHPLILSPASQKTTYTLVTSENKSVECIILGYYEAGITTLYYDECGIFEGVKTASDFEPYTGTMATLTTGTPLRGIPDTTVRDVMAWDGSSGTVTKNCAKVRLADLTWRYVAEQPHSNPRFYANDLKAIINIPPSANKANILCANYVTESDQTVGYNKQFDKGIAIGGDGNVYIVDKQYTTISDFVASLGDAELVYELATPTTEQLTSTENASIAGLRTFTPQTHAQNNAGAEMTVDYTIRVPTI